MSVAEIEKAISELPPDQLSQLTAWFEEFKADEWDKQIERDVKAGKLDAMFAKADEDFKAGRCTEL